MQDVAMEAVRTTPPKFETPKQKGGFTSLTGDLLREAQANMTNPIEGGVATNTESAANQYQEPTKTEDIDALMKQILTQEKPKKPEEAVEQIENNIPQEAKKQGFLVRIWEAIKNFFKNLFT